MSEKKGSGWLGWVLVVVMFGGVWWIARPGEEGRVFRGLDYEREDEEVCARGAGELRFSGEPESDQVGFLQAAVTGNASRAGAALSPWRTVNLFGTVQAQEADWTREGRRYVVRLVGPTLFDDDATVCLFELDGGAESATRA